MARKLGRQSLKEDESESYFITMSDIFSGILFIFLIIIVFFILQQVQKPSVENEKYRDYAELHKARLLEKLKDELIRDGVRVQINIEQDILTLPEGVLFDTGESALDSKSKKVIEALSRAFSKVLKCSVFSEQKRPMLEYIDCRRDNPDKVFLESIFIEGHTDNQPIKGELKGSPGINSNLRLSARRATETFSYLLLTNQLLSGFYSPVDKRIFAVSAYGETRPLNDNETEKGRSGNRRIDVRLIMYVPSNPGELKEYKQRIDKEFSITKQSVNIPKQTKEENKLNEQIITSKAEEELKNKELEAKRKAEKERKKKELEAKRKAEEEHKEKELEAKRKAEEELKKREREAKRKAEEKRKEKKLESKRKAEEERKKKELEAKRKAEKRIESEKKIIEAVNEVKKDFEKNKQKQLIKNKENIEEQKTDEITRGKSKDTNNIKIGNLEIISENSLEWESVAKFLNYKDETSFFPRNYYRLKFNALDVGFCDNASSEYFIYNNMIEDQVDKVCFQRHNSSFKFFDFFPLNINPNAISQPRNPNSSGTYYCDNHGLTSENRKLNLAVVFYCFDENKLEIRSPDWTDSIDKDKIQEDNKDIKINSDEDVSFVEENKNVKNLIEISQNNYQVKFDYHEIGELKEDLFGVNKYKLKKKVLEEKLRTICSNKQKKSFDSYDYEPSWEDKKNIPTCALEVGNFWYCTDKILVNFSCKNNN